MEHPILAWLSGHGRTQSWLAARARLSKQYVSQIVLGDYNCGGQAAIKLSRATGGEVSVEQLLLWKPRRRRKASAA